MRTDEAEHIFFSLRCSKSNKKLYFEKESPVPALRAKAVILHRKAMKIDAFVVSLGLF